MMIMTMIITTATIQTKELKLGNLTTAKAITFLDIETTHLDPSKSAILSISIITDWEDIIKGFDVASVTQSLW